MLIKTIAAATLAATLATAAFAGGAPTRFDVAEDQTRFVFASAPVFEEDGYPAHGNPFVSQGYIYPAGTLEGNATGVLSTCTVWLPS